MKVQAKKILCIGMSKSKKKPPVGKRLKELREGLSEKLGRTITQTEIGMMLGLDEDVASVRMNRYEKTVHIPDYESLEKIADYFGVPTFYFYVEDEYLEEIKKLFKIDI